MIRKIETGLISVDVFEEIKPYYQELFQQTGTSRLYKIRNWRERFHPEFLKDGEIYFTHPNELNDPFDIHRPVTFDVSVIETPEFIQRMIETAPEVMGVNAGRDAQIIAEKTLDEIKRDPHKYFMTNYENLINNPEYNNRIGVFSVTTNPRDDQLWGYYGGGLKGFAVGFDALELCEELFSQGHFVDYTDHIQASRIIGASQKEQSDLWFQKNIRWSFESEFRFVRIMDNQDRRKHYYPPHIVREIILGPRIPELDREEILEIIRNKYDHVKLYQLVPDYSGATMQLSEVGF